MWTSVRTQPIFGCLADDITNDVFAYNFIRSLLNDIAKHGRNSTGDGTVKTHKTPLCCCSQRTSGNARRNPRIRDFGIKPRIGAALRETYVGSTRTERGEGDRVSDGEKGTLHQREVQTSDSTTRWFTEQWNEFSLLMKLDWYKANETPVN